MIQPSELTLCLRELIPHKIASSTPKTVSKRVNPRYEETNTMRGS